MARDKGREFEPVDDTVVEWPMGVRAPESLESKIARMVRTTVSQFAASHGAETFDEADDFDVGDDEALPESIHELDDDQERLAHDLEVRRKIPPAFRDRFEREVEARRKAAEAKPALAGEVDSTPT